MREKREQRTKAAARARAREMRSREVVRARGAKLVASSSSSVHVTEEGERLAAAARHYVHALQVRAYQSTFRPHTTSSTEGLIYQ